MEKIPTIFVRDWDGMIGAPARFVLDEPHPDCGWVFAGEGIPTRKLDGTCCLVRGGALFKRHEVKPGRATPGGFEEVERDEETGAVVGWVPVGDGPEDRWHREAFAAFAGEASAAWIPEGTYELVGPKVQKNPEHRESHELIPHQSRAVGFAGVLGFDDEPPTDYAGLREWLATHDVEGIVWHHPDGRMAKIKGKDFGLKRMGHLE